MTVVSRFKHRDPRHTKWYALFRILYATFRTERYPSLQQSTTEHCFMVVVD